MPSNKTSSSKVKKSDNPRSDLSWVEKVFEDKSTRINSKSDNKKLLESDFFPQDKKEEEKNQKNTTKKETVHPEQTLNESDQQEQNTQELQEENTGETPEQEVDFTSDKEISPAPAVNLKKDNEIINYDFENLFFNWFSKKDKKHFEIWNNLLTKETSLFPFYGAKITMLDFYILSCIINALPENTTLVPKYTINFKIDEYREPVFLTKVWSSDNKYKLIQNEINGEQYLLSLEEAKQAKEELINVLKIGNNKIYRKNLAVNRISLPFDSLITVDKLYLFPKFNLNNGSKLFKNLTLLQKMLDKKYIKFITIDSLKKTAWLKLFKKLYSIAKKTTKNKYELKTPEEMYDALAQLGDKVLIPSDFDVSVHSEDIPIKYRKLYTFVYQSWISFALVQSECSEIIEIFFLNLYEFKADTIICPSNSGYNFKPNLFLPTEEIYNEIPQQHLMKKDFVIDPSTLVIKDVYNYDLSLEDLIKNISDTTFNIKDVGYIFKSLLNLIDSKIIKFNYENKLTLAPFLQTYLNEFKKEQYQKIIKNIKSLLNTYFSLSQDKNFYQTKISQDIAQSEQYKLNKAKIDSFAKKLDLIKKLLTK